MKTEFIFDIQLFAEMNVQTTSLDDKAGKNDLSPTMKTYYDTALLENAKEELYFNQFGLEQALPEGSGKKIEWRKFDTFGKVTEPLTEGVTPDGNTMNMDKVEAEVEWYGDYTTISDVLDLVAVDPIIVSCEEEHATQAAASLDTLTRNKITKGKYALYPEKDLEDGSKKQLYYREELDINCKMTPTLVNKAVTKLKKNKAPKINGKYIAIIHPSVSEDLRESDGWIEAHKYAAVTEIFNGEIGELHGVRFIESNEAPIFGRMPRHPKYGALTIRAVSSTAGTLNVNADGNTAVFTKGEFVDKYVVINGVGYKVTANDTYTLTLANLDGSVATFASGENVNIGDTIFFNNGTPEGLAVYGCLFFGKDAYGRVKLSGGALEMIVKAKGSAGTADPLNQRSTVGWKAAHAAAILYEERLLRVEVCSSYSLTDEQN